MEEIEAKQRAWLTLIRTPGLGALRLREWVSQHGSAQAALAALRGAAGACLQAPGRAWLRQPDAQRLQADLNWLAQPHHRLMYFTDLDFPPLLTALDAAPAALFVVGEAAHLLAPQIAIVGARAASAGGCASARAFASTLARAGLVVTSGLAEGIDGAAHTAALDAAAPTVAVTGTGPDRLYPRCHRDLAARIAVAGALVSEFPPCVGARPQHFPRRNRIIAGLSLGTLVVEAGLRSGALITARLAATAGREVFALPGSIHHPLAHGCHRLIREGAALVEGPDEVLAVLAPLARALGATLAERLAAAPVHGGGADDSGGGWRADADYARLLAALGHDPLPLETLVERTGLATAQLSSMLLMLELENVVASLPGGRFQRLPETTSTNVSA